jgi:hypothetical protein
MGDALNEPEKSFEQKFHEVLGEFKDLKIKHQQTHDQMLKYINLNKELLEKIETLDKANFFEIQLGEPHFIDTETFKGVVVILDQTNDFVKYKTKQNKIYYCNKSMLKFLGILDTINTPTSHTTLEEKKYE